MILKLIVFDLKVLDDIGAFLLVLCQSSIDFVYADRLVSNTYKGVSVAAEGFDYLKYDQGLLLDEFLQVFYGYNIIDFRNIDFILSRYR